MRICLFGDALPIYIIVYKQSSWRTEGINTWAKAIGKAQSRCCCSAAAALTGKKRLSNQAERARLPSPGLAGAVAAATAALCPVFAGAPVSWLQGRACGAQTNAGLGAWGRTSCLAPSLARFACKRSLRLLPAKQFINQSGIKHPLRSFAYGLNIRYGNWFSPLIIWTCSVFFWTGGGTGGTGHLPGDGPRMGQDVGLLWGAGDRPCCGVTGPGADGRGGLTGAVGRWGKPRGRQGQPGLWVPLGPRCWMLRIFVWSVLEVCLFLPQLNRYPDILGTWNMVRFLHAKTTPDNHQSFIIQGKCSWNKIPSQISKQDISPVNTL